MMNRTADTSVAALAVVHQDRATREALVLDGLRRYRQAQRYDPTAYELLRFLQVENPALDLNAVRPRLTELEDAKRVTKGDKRRCAVTCKTVYTWAVVSPSPVPVPFVDQVPLDAPRQMGLL